MLLTKIIQAMMLTPTTAAAATVFLLFTNVVSSLLFSEMFTLIAKLSLTFNKDTDDLPLTMLLYNSICSGVTLLARKVTGSRNASEVNATDVLSEQRR